MTSRRRIRERKRNRPPMGVPCEKPRRSQYEIIKNFLDGPDGCTTLTPAGAWFIAAIKNSQRISTARN
jgi:hypothetical protein